MHNQNSMINSRLTQWRQHHLLSLKSSFRELLKKPLATLMTLIVIAIAVALPSGLFALLQNLQTITSQWDHRPSISLYLNKGAPDFQVKSLLDEMKKNPAIAQVNYISPEQGLKDFQRVTETTDVIGDLKQNPLPAVIVITPSSAFESPEKLNSLVNAYKNSALIETTQLDLAWVQRLYNIISLGKRVTYSLGLIFGLGVLLIIGNTIRLTIEHRYDEMTILSLIGATNAFIRRPILYQGVLYGLLGGLIAWALVGVSFMFLKPPAQALASSYNQSLLLKGLPMTFGLMIVLFSLLLGGIGAWLGTRKQLRLLGLALPPKEC